MPLSWPVDAPHGFDDADDFIAQVFGSKDFGTVAQRQHFMHKVIGGAQVHLECDVAAVGADDALAGVQWPCDEISPLAMRHLEPDGAGGAPVAQDDAIEVAETGVCRHPTGHGECGVVSLDALDAVECHDAHAAALVRADDIPSLAELLDEPWCDGVAVALCRAKLTVRHPQPVSLGHGLCHRVEMLPALGLRFDDDAPA